MRANDVDWIERPAAGTDAVLVSAFSGWNDAGEAASEAAKFFRRRFRVRRIASIDPELYYDFASVRPTVQLDDDGKRVIEWPTPEVGYGELDDGRPVVTLVGIEPRLRWRRFCTTITDVAAEMNVTTAITLGALLADTHHTLPINVVGASNNIDLRKALGLQPSRYEGPTGIIGVLNDACHQAGLKSVSFWATVPTYVNSYSSPKAALALIDRVAAFLGTEVHTGDLHRQAANYEQHIEQVLANDERLQAYAEEVLRQSQAEVAEQVSELDANPEALVSELEHFLRQQDE